MVKIRLRRVGARNNPKYRVIVADSRSARDGSFIEVVGHYDPIRNPEVLDLKQDRIKEWLKKGAQPSDGALKLFYKTGLMPRPEYKVKKKEAAPQEATKAKAEPAPAKPPETPKPEAKAATKEK
jgi:small subunit ribosomal protein S16